uniref:Methenyltetrahydrofolate synthase domain-containing protein n=1 Tax=Pogona vitticeps TaxID=103695 RepID=A0A6J0UTV1_9SAUR
MEVGERGARAGISKWDIRQKIWDYMEANNLADFPRPVHHRIPNFKGSYQLSCSIQGCDMFNKAKEVKVDPDKPLEGIRLAILQARKTLLVPTPRLRTGLFNRIVPPPGATKEVLRKCATSQGVRDYSVPVGLDAKVQVDLVVVGSVAVSEKGWRIGKGEGYADMEYAMMVSMGAVREDTVVITAVHDCQVVDIPEELLGDHDLTVDYILTPTRTIKTGCKRPKPQGILWHKISHETMAKIPILKKLHHKEKGEGKDVTLGDDRPERPAAGHPTKAACDRQWQSAGWQKETVWAQAGLEQELVSEQPAPPLIQATVYVGGLPPAARVSELKEELQARHATPARLTWHGARHQEFLHYASPSAAEGAITTLQGLKLHGSPLRIEWARSPPHPKTSQRQ